MERVVVTGVGVISALGSTTEEFRTSLFAGHSGIRPLSLVDPNLFRFTCGAEVRGYDSRHYIDDRTADLMDRFAQFAVVAARAAVADAAIEWTPPLLERTAVITGSCLGGQSSEDASFFDLYHKGRPNVHPLTIPRAMANAGACQISMDLGIIGPSYTISTACSSSAYAIGQAFWMLRGGALDLALAGGSEAPFSVGVLKAWDGLRVVSDDTCRPF